MIKRSRVEFHKKWPNWGWASSNKRNRSRVGLFIWKGFIFLGYLSKKKLSHVTSKDIEGIRDVTTFMAHFHRLLSDLYLIMSSYSILDSSPFHDLRISTLELLHIINPQEDPPLGPPLFIFVPRKKTYFISFWNQSTILIWKMHSDKEGRLSTRHNITYIIQFLRKGWSRGVKSWEKPQSNPSFFFKLDLNPPIQRMANNG